MDFINKIRGHRSDLQSLPIGGLINEQVANYTREGLQSKQALTFDPNSVGEKVAKLNGRTILAIDIGGDKMAQADFAIDNGELQNNTPTITPVENFGANLLAKLAEIGEQTQKEQKPVGISIAGPVENTHYFGTPNLINFADKLKQDYDQDLGKLVPGLQMVVNDAVSGLIASSAYVARKQPVTKVAYIIVGSGIGGAVLTNQSVQTAEPGHIKIVDQLNPFHQTQICGMGGRNYTCVELVGASKAGIENIWQQLKNETLEGREISKKVQAGDSTAIALYDNSARIVAHVYLGLRQAFGFDEIAGQEAVVFHGGIFQVPGYEERLKQYLATYLKQKIPVYFTKDFTQNACLEGAALAATLAE